MYASYFRVLNFFFIPAFLFISKQPEPPCTKGPSYFIQVLLLNNWIYPILYKHHARFLKGFRIVTTEVTSVTIA